jgi:hypothetical protein
MTRKPTKNKPRKKITLQAKKKLTTQKAALRATDKRYEGPMRIQ